MSVSSARNQSSIDAAGLNRPKVRCKPGLKSWNSALPSVRRWCRASRRSSRAGRAPTSGVIGDDDRLGALLVDGVEHRVGDRRRAPRPTRRARTCPRRARRRACSGCEHAVGAVEQLAPAGALLAAHRVHVGHAGLDLREGRRPAPRGRSCRPSRRRAAGSRPGSSRREWLPQLTRSQVHLLAVRVIRPGAARLASRHWLLRLSCRPCSLPASTA